MTFLSSPSHTATCSVPAAEVARHPNGTGTVMSGGVCSSSLPARLHSSSRASCCH